MRIADVPACYERSRSLEGAWREKLWLTAVVGAMLAPWLLVWLLTSDLPGWPLNDDPFYAKPLAFWSEQGRIQFVRQYGFLTASSVAHIGVGLLATLNGLHFRQLYLVCIAQQAAAVIALYWFARRLKLSRVIAIVASASLLTFPLYLGHAFTYMTDGPAAAWSTLACVALTIGMLEQPRWPWLVAGASAIGWGYWIRQTNAALLVAPCALILATRYLRKPAHSRIPAWPLCLALLMILALECGWLVPASTSRIADIAPRSIDGYWHRTAIAGYGGLLIAGWYCLPLAPWLTVQAYSHRYQGERLQRKICQVGTCAALLAVALPLWWTNGRAHITSATGSFIQNGHYGPIFLSDMDEPGRWGSLAGVEWPAWIWQSLSLLACVSIAAFAWWICWAVTQTLQTLRSCQASTARPLLAIACSWLFVLAAVALILVFFVEPHLDRYWLFVLPVMTVICLLLAAEQRWEIGRWSIAWASVCIVLHLAMSTAFVHDMLAWNNARWQYVNAHLSAGHLAESLDAGRDVNAWLRMDEDPDTSARPGDASRWWSGRASICIATGPRPGWKPIDQLPWHSWATGREHFLLVLAKSPPNDKGVSD